MNEDLDKLALRLHDLFAVGGRLYLLQQPDGRYFAIRRRLSVGRIRKMLESEESIAAFQFCGGLTQWICLDFDLHRDFITNGVTETDLSLVLDATRKCSQKLRELGLPHLVEYSGNRGFHIWVITSQRLTRANASQMLDNILAQSEFTGGLDQVKIDRYPSNSSSQSSSGRGVKLPLSKHVKSGCYSFIIADVSRFVLDEQRHVRKLNQFFLAEQLKLLGSDIVCKRDEAFRILGLKPQLVSSEPSSPSYLRVSLEFRGQVVPTLNEVLNTLRRCNCVDGLLHHNQSGKTIDEDVRVAIVGMFMRLRSEARPALGLELLQEFFATLPGYDRIKTEDKLRDLARLRPPTCEHLRSILPQYGCNCAPRSGDAASPVHYLLDIGFVLIKDHSFSLSIDDIHAIRRSQQVYCKENDEVPLYWTERELENLSDLELSALCLPTELDRFHVARYHEFERLEPENSTRRLLALSAPDNIWTTASIVLLNDIIHSGFSRHSYGYKLVPYLIGDRIFQHWLKQWKSFTSHLGELIYAPEYSEWTLIKIDIKSFYDTIDLERLRVKLYDGPTTSLRLVYRDLTPDVKDKCRLIVDKLIDLCRVTSKTGKGVPQGPAFARFLAEVYLMEFDEIAEGHPQIAPGHYARYVDDIFIVVPPNADVLEIENEFLTHLGTLGLKHNPDKHFRGRIRDYRGKFSEYWQDTKYFIDQVSRKYNSVPIEEVRHAARELYSLVDAGGCADINNEHLSFLYTHLGADAAMGALRRRIEDYVLRLRQRHENNVPIFPAL